MTTSLMLRDTLAASTDTDLALPVAPAVSGHKWYAIFTRSHHEKAVAGFLSQRGIDSFVPLYRTTHRWKNRRRVELELPLFPNYVFVRTALRQCRYLVDAPGVLSLVGTGRGPSPLPDPEVEMLRSDLYRNRLTPCDYLNVGDRVRICEGPMAGLEGILVRHAHGMRVVISIDLIMRSVAVEVDESEVELISRHARISN